MYFERFKLSMLDPTSWTPSRSVHGISLGTPVRLGHLRADWAAAIQAQALSFSQSVRPSQAEPSFF